MISPSDEIQPAPKQSAVQTKNAPVDVSVGEGDVEMAVNEAGPQKDRQDGRVVDAVWGTIEDGGPNYRNLGW